MKLKMTNELAWLIGFWKMRRTRIGIGVIGNPEIQQKFVKKVIELKLTPPEKIRVEKRMVVFRHIKLENFFRKVVENQNEIFNRPNKLTISYLKGMCESALKDNILKNATFQDAMLIERLGFYTTREGRSIKIIKINEFLSFLKRFDN